MGARINFVFKNNEGPHVVLYSHWGQGDWKTDIAEALDHARPRWSDESYFTRMVISYLIKDQLMDQHGFGIYSINDISENLGDQTIIIDINQETVIDEDVKLDWDLFVHAYGMLPPKVLVEQTV
jgi:hypothetical protein